jgi:mannosyltransferase
MRRRTLGSAARELWPIAAATALALALGLWKLGHQSFDLDEGVSGYTATLPLRDVLSVWDSEPNNLLYFGLLFLWDKLGSGDEFTRLPSVLAYVAAVPLTAAIAWRSFGRSAGIAAGFLLAVNVFAIEMAQNARAFALVMALTSASTLCFMLAVERSTWQRWAAWGVLSGLAIYAFPTAVFVIVAQAISLAWLPPGRVPWRQAGIAAAALILSTLPLLIHLATSPTDRISWVASTNAQVIGDTLRSLTGGYFLESFSRVIAYGALAVIAAVILFLHRPRRSEGSWRAALPILWLAVPLILALLVSLKQPIFHDSYLIVILPALAIVAAGVLTRLRPWPLAAVAVAALCVLHTRAWRTWYDDLSKEDFRGAAHVLEAHGGTSQIILVWPAAVKNPVSWYIHRDVSSRAEPGKIAPVSDLGLLEAAVLSRSRQRVWLIERQEGSAFDESAFRRLIATRPVLGQWNLKRVRVRLLGP